MSVHVQRPSAELAPAVPADVAPAPSVPAGASARAFLELTKPGITRMVLVTTAAGFYLAAGAPFDFVLLVHTLIGTALAASGCNALNQYVERDADARMQRTAGRPLPSGRLDATVALTFAVGISVLGLLQLLLFVNVTTAALVLLTLVSYVFVYTPLKRRTWHATVIGAVPGALPILAGWTAAGGSIGVAGLVLFAILFAWQMPHFFALAWIYRADYARGGFQMLTVLDTGGARTGVQVLLWAALLLALSTVPTWIGLTGTVYLVGALLLGTAFLLTGAALAARRTERMAARVFGASIAYLPALLILMVLDKTPL